MKKILLVLLLSPWAISSEIIALGDLRLDMKIPDVLSALGEPDSKREQADFITDIFFYTDLEAYFNGDWLIGVYTESSAICTPEKICPGSTVESAILEYGKPHENTKDVFEFYEAFEFTCWYRMKGIGGLIASIEIACQP